MATDANRTRRRGPSLGGALDRRSTRLREATQHGLRDGTHWLAADSRAVIAVRRVEQADAFSPAAGSSETSARAFEAGLRQWAGRVRRKRALVLARRQLTAAAVLACALQILVLVGAIPQGALLAVLIPLALGMLIGLRRALSLEGVARLLDERLVLFDQLATALYLEQRAQPAGGPLARRAVGRAHELLRTESSSWRVSASPARHEWLGLGAALALLALLLALAVSGAVSTGSGHHPGSGDVETELAKGPPSGRAGQAGSTPASRRHNPQQHPSAPSTSTRAGVSDENHQSTPEKSSTATSGQLHPSGVTESIGHDTTTKGVHTPGSSIQPNEAGTTSAGQAANEGISAVPHASAPAPPPKLASIPSAGNGKSGSPSSPGASQSGSGQHGALPGQGHGGEAGHTGGNMRLGQAHAIGGNPTEEFQLKSGYTPTRSGKNGTISPEIEGAGGHARSLGVTGEGASGVVSSYVPPDGGASAEGRRSLLESYLSSLQWVEAQLASW